MNTIIAYLDWKRAVKIERKHDKKYRENYNNKGIYALLRKSNGYNSGFVVSYIGISYNDVIKRVSQHDMPISRFKVADVRIRGDGNVTSGRLEAIEHALIHYMVKVHEMARQNINKRCAPEMDVIIHNRGQKSLLFSERIEVRNCELIDF